MRNRSFGSYRERLLPRVFRPRRSLSSHRPDQSPASAAHCLSCLFNCRTNRRFGQRRHGPASSALRSTSAGVDETGRQRPASGGRLLGRYGTAGRGRTACHPHGAHVCAVHLSDAATVCELTPDRWSSRISERSREGRWGSMPFIFVQRHSWIGRSYFKIRFSSRIKRGNGALLPITLYGELSRKAWTTLSKAEVLLVPIRRSLFKRGCWQLLQRNVDDLLHATFELIYNRLLQVDTAITVLRL